MLAFFDELPAWLLSLNAWDIAGILAYTQLFALLESAAVLLFLVLLALLLPARFFRDRFVAHSTLLVFLASIWAIAAQSDSTIIPRFSLDTLFLWLGLYLAFAGISYLVIRRSGRLEKGLGAFAERLTVLLYVYLPVTLLSAIIVIIRNI